MKRYKTVALTVVIILLLLMGCNGTQAVEGPSTDSLTTTGVFEPGGYITFRFSPEIKSIKGLYRGKILTYAVSSENVNIDYTLWPYDKTSVGKDWGDSISSTSSSKTFVVKHKVQIPNDDSLAEKTVVFIVKYSLHYPVHSGSFAFKNDYKRFKEYIQIELNEF